MRYIVMVLTEQYAKNKLDWNLFWVKSLMWFTWGAIFMWSCCLRRDQPMQHTRFWKFKSTLVLLRKKAHIYAYAAVFKAGRGVLNPIWSCCSRLWPNITHLGCDTHVWPTETGCNVCLNPHTHSLPSILLEGSYSRVQKSLYNSEQNESFLVLMKHCKQNYN